MNYSVYRNKNEEKNGETMAHRYGECYKAEEEGHAAEMFMGRKGLCGLTKIMETSYKRRPITEKL